MFTRRQLKVIDLLSKNNTLTAQEISDYSNVSTKTIRNDILKINNSLEDVTIIESIPGIGYQMNNSIDIRKILQSSEDNNYMQVENPLDRAHQIIILLLERNDYIKINEISEIFYVDRTSISKDLRYVRNCLMEYSLSLENKPHYGLIVKGEEIEKRHCLIDYGFTKTNFLQRRYINTIDLMKSSVYEVLSEDGIEMSNIPFDYFIYNLLIQSERHISNPLLFDDEIITKIEPRYEFLVAKDVLSITTDFLSLSVSEITYVAMHILTKKTNMSNELDISINQKYEKTTYQEINDMLQHVYEVFDVDLRLDSNLVKSLWLHYNQMIQRLEYGLSYKNDIENKIIRNYTQASLIAHEMLTYKFSNDNLEFSQNEISLVALHIEYAITRSISYVNRILLVNEYGVLVTEIMKIELMKEFGKRIEIVDVVGVRNLDSTDLSNVDLIVSTESNIPVYGKDILYVSPILTEDDINRIERYNKPNAKKSDISIIQTNIYSIDDYKDILEEEGIRHDGYYLRPLLIDGLLLKVKIVDSSSNGTIIIKNLSESVIYQTAFINKVIIVSLPKTKMRRTLRNLYEHLDM